MIPRLARMGSARPIPSLFVLTPLQVACRRASTQILHSNKQANGPSTTLPATLEIPARDPGQNILSYAFQSGKAYWGFYKQGVKNVWANRKLANEVKSKHRSASGMALTRHDFQLLRRSRHDMRRVPAFALLLLVFGEWLPLIVIFVNGLVPLPCRIPRQVQSAERKREDQRYRGRLLLSDTSQRAGLHSQHVPSGDTQLKALSTLRIDLKTATKNLLDHKGTALPAYLQLAFTNFNLRSPLWDRTSISAIMPTVLWKHRLKRHLTYMATDDALLLRHGGVKSLSAEEVLFACTERGIRLVEEDGQVRRHQKLREDLTQWLEKKRSEAWLKLFEKELK
ncbi:letm1-like protein [Diplodia corticola]|uniref:Letm1-like protein n=1 Tax=Diplodia corticola TaxID=236234 RepID=A0A1J9RD16_9PEZI|nr:letm1-like protein [Diplodia corticola]OJD38002.1 letm1-like protein [Diplodia corticola]